MYQFRNVDDSKRRLLVKLLAAATWWSAPVGRTMADVFGEMPARLPADRSIYRIEGNVTVNGAPATLKTRIGASDTVETGKKSEAIFVKGESAFMLRESSRLTFVQESNALTNALRLLTGKMLAVFGPNNPQQITTITASFGIRGTGVYAETNAEQTYFCTCYGIADIIAKNDPESRRTVTSNHHDEPLYILADAKPGNAIRKAPFINHTDQELMLIETLVGRTTPFVFPSGNYRGPRRDY